ncbi:hypothetical protein ACGFW5_09590 [Streptomyces sp. NPDC048416]|uniref:hypothetical protein n=1 Tax=Streptomyces sp. NPDC048416 TaxID=3365546 RepID=UPI00370FB2CE
MALQTFGAMDEFDDLIEDLVHGSPWAPPTDTFVCWAEAAFPASAHQDGRLTHIAA